MNDQTERARKKAVMECLWRLLLLGGPGVFMDVRVRLLVMRARDTLGPLGPADTDAVATYAKDLRETSIIHGQSEALAEILNGIGLVTRVLTGGEAYSYLANALIAVARRTLEAIVNTDDTVVDDPTHYLSSVYTQCICTPEHFASLLELFG